jgi:hypothetical protein
MKHNPDKAQISPVAPPPNLGADWGAFRATPEQMKEEFNHIRSRQRS